MDELLAAIILAIVQGLTEWLPVSSSGHLAVFHFLTGFRANLLFDVALHFGTLMAVFVYFGRDIMKIIEDFLRGKWDTEHGKMGWLILVGSIPAAIIGFTFRDLFEQAFSELYIVAIGFAITGLLLLIASLDSFRNQNKSLSYLDAFLVGCAQAFAILPGVSRSGSTISAGLMRGVSPALATRFSFLLSIPAIFGAGLLEISDKKLSPELLWGTLIAFFVGLATIHFLMKLMMNSKKNLRWFAGYVLLLAILVFSLRFFNLF